MRCGLSLATKVKDISEIKQINYNYCNLQEIGLSGNLMNAQQKNKLAGISLMAHGSLTGCLYLSAMTLIGFSLSGDPDMPPLIIWIVMAFIAFSFSVFVLPQIIGGWKMYKEQPNARNWGIIGAISASLSGFMGIAAGVFTIIFLFGEDGKRFYNSLSSKNYLDPANPIDDFTYRNYQQQPREPYSWK